MSLRRTATLANEKSVSLLGLMAKIKCSICSYQLNNLIRCSLSSSYIKLIFGTGLWNRGLPRPSHGLSRYCTTSEYGPLPHSGGTQSKSEPKDNSTSNEGGGFAVQAGPLSAASGQGWLPHRVGDREGASHKRMACHLDGVRWSLRG